MENPATWTDLDRTIASVLGGHQDAEPSVVAGAVLKAVADDKALSEAYAPPSGEQVEQVLRRYRDETVLGHSLQRAIANLFVRRFVRRSKT